MIVARVADWGLLLGSVRIAINNFNSCSINNFKLPLLCFSDNYQWRLIWMPYLGADDALFVRYLRMLVKQLWNKQG
jgi:hypothetical protein